MNAQGLTIRQKKINNVWHIQVKSKKLQKNPLLKGITINTLLNKIL